MESLQLSSKMVLTVKVPIKLGKEIRGFLKNKHIYEDKFLPLKESEFIFLPIRETTPNLKKELSAFTKEYSIEKVELRSNHRTRSFRRELQKIVPSELYPNISRAYEQIGTIAIITIFPETEKYEKEIAKALLETNKGIKTVVKKTSKYNSKTRIQLYKHLAGEKTTETIHHENNIELYVDISKVYFSARTANERKRITNLIRNNENILVMFSGIAPFPLVIAKNSGAKSITGIELNKTAHEYALKNLRLNNITNVNLIQANVHEVVKDLKSKFDKIIMPHPTEADYFLNDAMSVANNNCIIYLYHFSKKDKLHIVEDKIRSAVKKNFFFLKKTNILELAKVSSDVYKYCIEINIKKRKD